jgi:hypothetical protein
MCPPSARRRRAAVPRRMRRRAPRAPRAPPTTAFFGSIFVFCCCLLRKRGYGEPALQRALSGALQALPTYLRLEKRASPLCRLIRPGRACRHMPLRDLNPLEQIARARKLSYSRVQKLAARTCTGRVEKNKGRGRRLLAAPEARQAQPGGGHGCSSAASARCAPRRDVPRRGDRRARVRPTA